MNKLVVLFFLNIAVVNLAAADAVYSDSVRLEYKNGQAFIIHEVEDGETLYAISRRYGSSMNSIAQATPEVKTGLHNGMMLRIPYNPNTKPIVTAQTEHVVAQGETLYSISQIYKISVIEIMEWNDLLSSTLSVGQVLLIKGNAAKPPPDYVLDGMRIHVVQAGEGLYAVARIYEVSVDDLVEWNDLESNSLNLGQELVVGKESTEEAPATTQVVTKPTEVQDDKSVPQEVEVVAVATAPMVAVVEDAGNTKELPDRKPLLRRSENGLAAGIDGEGDKKSFLALHRSIPVGSLVAVRNEMNNQVVFVRIVGKLPDTGINDKVIIRLSSAAVEQLKALDPKFRVELTYLVDE
jgi:LysM repeat protein